ncbi:MAG: hypothetical protein P8Y48_02435, partial [Novosphingobium sp.]
PIQEAWREQKRACGDEPAPLPLPPVQLEIDCAGFAPDYFVWGGLNYVSARLRAIIDLPDGFVEYLAVDARKSRPEVIAQDYRIMNPLMTRSLVDLERTAHEVLETVRMDVSTETVVVLTPEHREYWREGFVPDVPLFRMRYRGRIVADDAIATGVLEAGVTDVVFRDYVCDEAQTAIALKRL